MNPGIGGLGGFRRPVAVVNGAGGSKDMLEGLSKQFNLNHLWKGYEERTLTNRPLRNRPSQGSAGLYS
jgi:hypothetical protein